ncbi:group 1 truncated hemoglobin [Brevundimonas sp.]|uniref:group I truncated hemoglobin n=1 Tax=Brevundimonas sp. TaxID=1871086 RepID=UPI0027317300|nr:group 1 truncated hemoglobin [Brevundimonas sp.]MDP1912993.1 group 1 truncated hemoglobin [Brevundimonas sp.]
MIGKLTLAAAVAAFSLPAMAQDPAHRPGEEAVDPYVVAEANAGAGPFEGTEMLEAFHGREGSDRIVDGLLDRSVDDPRIAGIFTATDMVRLRRTLKEQFCYILNGGCAYSGRTMQDAHDDIGLQPADMGALVEHLQAAMDAEGVPFRTQNRFLARLAPMRRDVVTR